MYYSFNSYVKAKVFLEDNPSGKIVSWNYASNEPVKFRVFVAKEITSEQICKKQRKGT